MFVTQRMAAWGLQRALAALPCLAFLRTSAIMGAGARVGEAYGVKEQVGRAATRCCWLCTLFLATSSQGLMGEDCHGWALLLPSFS